MLGAGGPWERAYLFAAIRTRFIDRCRREQLVVFEPEDAGAIDPSAAADTRFAAEAADLQRALATLRPLEREALYLSAVEGYTAREIAALTGHPRATVLSLLHRARGKLRRLLLQPEETHRDRKAP